ncbi:MAG: CotH kinase family protein [Bacteroidota bacterium]
MRRPSIFISLLLLAFICSTCSKDTEPEMMMEEAPRYFSNTVGIDLESSLLIYNGTEQNLSIEGEEINFADTVSQIRLGQAYSVDWQGEAFNFFRTELPIIKIQTRSAQNIDVEYAAAQFNLIEAGEITEWGNLGIRLRGNTSLQFPKKSYRLELWEDEQGLENRKISLLEMREDDDWLLDGMWNEPLMIRDKGTMDLWLGFGRVAYQAQEPDLQLGADRHYCELFIDDQYQGLYYLGERLDRKQLKLEKISESSDGGELYKAKGWGEAVGGFSIPAVDNNLPSWGNYWIKYPQEPGSYDWNKLEAFTRFYLEADNETFATTYSDWIDVDNIIDYFILISLTGAFDNSGNNIYIARRNQQSNYYFVSWDFDATFGLGIFGEEIPSPTGFVIHHKLTQRLINDDAFRTSLKERWNALRNGHLTNQNIMQIYTNSYTLLQRNNIYERESLVPRLDRPLPAFSSLDFLENILNEQLAYLDEYISTL